MSDPMPTSGDEPSLGGHPQPADTPALGGERAILHLIEMLKYDESAPESEQPEALRRIESAIEALARIGHDQAISALTDYLHSTNEYQFQRRIIEGISNLKVEGSLAFLLEILDDPTVGPQETVIEQMLRWFPDVRVIEPLYARIGKRPWSNLWYSLVRTFARSDQQALQQRLLEQITSADDSYRYAAAVAYTLVEPPDTLPTMINLLRHDAEPLVRRQAARVLEYASDPQLADVLLEALGDSEREVRSAVRAAMLTHRDARFNEAVRAHIEQLPEHPDPNTSRNYYEGGEFLTTLIELVGHPIAPYLVDVMQRPGFSVSARIVAFEKFVRPVEPYRTGWREAQVRHRDEVIAILLYIVERDPAQHLRHQAANALGDMGVHEAVEPLCRLLEQDDVLEAIIALGQLRDPRALPTLRAHVGQTVWGDYVDQAIARIEATEA